MGKLVSNYLFTVVYQLLLVITPFITTPYVSRVLGPKGVGTDAYVLSIVQLFLVFAALGIPMYGSRQVATKQELNERSKEFWSIYLVQLFISLFTLAVYIGFIFTFHEYRSLFLIHILDLLAALLDVSWYFIGKERIKSVTTRNMLVKVIGIILIFTFVKNYQNLPIYIMINAATLFVGQLVMWIPLLKEITFQKVAYQDAKAHFGPILSLFLPQIMTQVYLLVNRIVLGRVSGEVQVGYYNQADKVVRIALGFITSLGSVLLPRMAKEFSMGNIESMKVYIHYAIQFVLMVTLPMTLGLMGITPNFVPWFLGNQFMPVINLLILMSPAIFFVGLANIFGIQILVSINQQNKYAISITVGAILSLIVNLLFVSRFASLGTTIALLVAEAVGAVIQMYYARKYYSFKTFLSMFFKYLILSVIVYLAVTSIDKFVHINPLLITALQLVIAACVYLAGLLIVKDSILMMMLKTINQRFFARGR